MAVRIGAFDPIALVFGLMNLMLRKKLISDEEARAIIRDSLDPSMTDAEKDKFIDSLRR